MSLTTSHYTDIIVIEVHVQAPESHINVIPTITVQDVDSKPAPTTPSAQTPPHDYAVDAPPVLGGLPPHLASVIPSWYKVGWRHMSGIDEPLRDGEEKDKGVLDLFLSEQLYGDWYHNAAIIFFVRSRASVPLASQSDQSSRRLFLLPTS